MTSTIESTAKVLDSLKRWQWERYDPDGVLMSNMLELSDVVNRLAFQGHVNPEADILNLLSAGEITAFCNYNWLKYHRGRRYQMAQYMSMIDASKWKIISQLREDEIRQFQSHEWPDQFLDLEKLEMKDCEIILWSPSDSRAAYALCPPDTNKHHPTYFEEWFSATDIHICGPIADEQQELSADANEGGREILPPLSQAELLKWWESKANIRDALSKDELLVLVRAKYPDKSIARDRVRSLVGSRKRGPKQFSG